MRLFAPTYWKQTVYNAGRAANLADVLLGLVCI
jgi:hypothetical protein